MRYQRQILLPEIAEMGQAHLLKSKILIIGAGGLGHPVFQYLVGMGIGHIGVMDGDLVDESNLHRQVLFSESDIGKNKADCLQSLSKFRQDPVKVISYPFFLRKKSALEIFPQYDVIVDGSDNFKTKMLINDVCCLLAKPMVFGSISQFEGQISVFWQGHGPCYRCLIPEIPKANIQNCAEAGVVGALPGVIGSLQALEALKVLLFLRNSNSTLKPLIGKIQHFDFANNLSHVFSLPIQKTCECHSSEFNSEMIPDIEGETEFCMVPISGTLLDVREQVEWDEFHVTTSVHWALSKIEAGVLPIHLKDKTVMAICKSGFRAERACQILKKHGFKVNYTERSIYGYGNQQTSSNSSSTK